MIAFIADVCIAVVIWMGVWCLIGVGVVGLSLAWPAIRSWMRRM